MESGRILKERENVVRESGRMLKERCSGWGRSIINIDGEREVESKKERCQSRGVYDFRYLVVNFNVL